MELKTLAKEAYVYGFPLVYNIDEIVRHVEDGVGANKAAPYNSFSHAATLAGPEDKFVTINNDTVYSMAQLDLSEGPVILKLPETGSRYFVMQFIDAWTNNFAYIGTRSIGSEGGTFTLLPPGTETLHRENEIVCPTMIVSILGRWSCSGEEDLEAVIALQNETKLFVETGEVTTRHVPKPREVKSDLLFWEKLRIYLQEFPDSPVFKPLQQSLEPLGVWETTSPYLDPADDLYEALVDGAQEGQKFLQEYLIHSDIAVQNGWQLVYHSFDYNVEYFGLGTIKSDEWVMPTGTADEIREVVIHRAAAALGGLWGNHGYEACYSSIYTDSQGERLTGTNSYQVTFATQPPVDAFWSITMYDATNFYLVANEINRYSIGDRTKDIQFNEDGSLTFVISHNMPVDPKERANWLPAPKGLFRPVLRMYLPGEAVTTATYVLPPIERLA